MAVLYLLILVSALFGIRFCQNGFYEDFLGKEQCNAIKGIFILFVFAAHILGAVEECGFGTACFMDKLAFEIRGKVGQLIVALFLFYSGYGVMMSFRRKGESYLKSYPKSRLLSTLVNFDIAVCCYVLLAWIMGRPAGFSKIALSMIGWDSVGNSNWYIFVILSCYLVFYLVFKVVRDRYFLGSILVGALVLIGMLILHDVKDAHWYNTMLVFPAGVFYACYAEVLNKWIQMYYGWVLALLTMAFLVLHFGGFRDFHGLTFNAKSILFSLLVIVLTMKVRIGNKWLNWCGLSLFPLYIYQQLPMIVFQETLGDEWVCGYPFLFIGACFLVSVGIALLYNRYLRIKFV